MADYENLLDSIDAAIKANNRREITGQILQNTLHQMVGSLGENYQLAGFATPTTNPNSPDQNVFYITDETGVYTNFDNITLGTGLSFLMWKNEAWTAKTLNVVTAQWVDDNYVSKAFLRNMFRFYDEDGVEIFANDTQSVVDNIKAMVGLWTEQYLSALGLGDDSGGGGAGDVTWELLADNTDTRPIAISHLTSALSDYATQSWVQQQGYATQAALNALEYLNSVSGNNGDMVLSTNKGNSFVVDFTHEHSWFDVQDRPSTIAGYGLGSELNISNGEITIGGQTIIPVTSVAMSVPLGLNVSGSPITKTGTLAVTYANGYEGFTTALKEKIEALFSWFEVDENGNVKTKDYTEDDTLKHRGFYSPSFISALGMGDDGGGGGQGDVTWTLLADNTDTRQIALSHLTDALAGYATQAWVNQQGFALQSSVNALEFLNNITSAEGYVTFITNKNNSFVVDFTHQHSWFEVQDRPTTISGFGIVMTADDIPALDWSKITTGKPTTLVGYGIVDAKIENGVITLGSNTITPVTSVAMTMPTGFGVTGSPISKTGTLAVTYSNGYEGFTTALKEKIEALFSWFELDSDGNVKTKDWDDNGTTKHRGFYSPSFISALGLGSDGQAGSGDVTWVLLADNNDNRQIALSHLTSALETYATQLWVQNQGYATQSWVTSQGYALQSVVDALEFVNGITSTGGCLIFSTNKNNTTIVDFTHEHSWFDIQDRPDTLDGYGVTDAYIDANGVHLGGSAYKYELPLAAATVRGGAMIGFITNVSDRNYAVQLSSEKMYVNVPWTDHYDWEDITRKPTTLSGYGITDANIANGVITLGSNTITPVTSVAMSVPTGFGINGSPITKTGTLTLSYSNGYEGFTTALKEKIEALYSWFELDSDGNVKTKDYTEGNETKHRGFYSPSFISALGLGNDGSTGSGDVTWTLLADNTDTRQIALSHLTTALTDYATQSWVQSQGYALQSTVSALEFLNNIVAAEGYLTFSTNKNNTTIVDFTHQHSWFDIQDRPDTIAGYNITDAKIVNGTITLGENSITPLTQHQSLANYYTKAETNSAISTAIGALEYLNQASGGSGVLTLTTNKSNSFVVDFTHQHSFLELIDRPTTIKGYGITDAITTSNIGSQSVSYASSAGSATSASKLSALATITYGQNSLQYCDKYSESSSNPTNAVGNPTGDWYHHIVMNHANSGGYFVDLAVCFHSSNFWYRRIANGSAASWVRVIDTDNIGSQSVNYATSAGSASSATYATSAGSASSASYATSAGDSDTCDGLHVHSGRNNEANKIVRTDGYGYMQCGWINTSSGGFNGDISGITKVYCSEDDYIRYLSPSDFISAMSLMKNYGNNNSRPNGTTFTLPSGTNAVQMRSGATSGADIGIFHLSDDNAFVCNSSDEGYLFAAFDTDQTANFSTGDNAAFVVHSNHAGVSIKGNFYATGGVTCLSDERKKDVLGNINLSIEQIAYAPAVRFLWKDRRNNDVQAGSIAQYWQKVLPEVVTNKNDELGLQYGATALIASIITAKAVVDHERRIKDLERENSFLKEQIKQLKAA